MGKQERDREEEAEREREREREREIESGGSASIIFKLIEKTPRSVLSHYTWRCRKMRRTGDRLGSKRDTRLPERNRR